MSETSTNLPKFGFDCELFFGCNWKMDPFGGLVKLTAHFSEKCDINGQIRLFGEKGTSHKQMYSGFPFLGYNNYGWIYGCLHFCSLQAISYFVSDNNYRMKS